ncbi:hypothetical protein SMICM17S_04527 [Streptomyces microflavus]
MSEDRAGLSSGWGVPGSATGSAADCRVMGSRVLTGSPRRSDRAVRLRPVPPLRGTLRTRTACACSPSFRSIARFLRAGTPVPWRRAPANREKPMRAGRIPGRGTVHDAAINRGARQAPRRRTETFRSTAGTGVRPRGRATNSTHPSANTRRSGPNCPSAVALWWRPPHRAPPYRWGGSVRPLWLGPSHDAVSEPNPVCFRPTRPTWPDQIPPARMRSGRPGRRVDLTAYDHGRVTR